MRLPEEKDDVSRNDFLHRYRLSTPPKTLQQMVACFLRRFKASRTVLLKETQDCTEHGNAENNRYVKKTPRHGRHHYGKDKNGRAFELQKELRNAPPPNGLVLYGHSAFQPFVGRVPKRVHI